MGLGMGFAVLLMLGMLAYLAWNAKPDMTIYAQLGAVFVVTIGVAVFNFRDLYSPRELRVTASRVGIFRRGKCLAEAVLADVFASRKVLLIGRSVVVYQLANPQLGKIPAMFDIALLDRALLARLPPANLMNDRGMQAAMMKRQPVLVVLFAGAAAACAWLAYRTLWG